MVARGDLWHMRSRYGHGTLPTMTRLIVAIHIAGGAVALLSHRTTAHQHPWDLTVAMGAFAAQSLATTPTDATFEVASIKPTSRASAPAPQVLPSGQFEMREATLRDLIRVAYPSAQGQVDVVGGPDWVRSGRFNVVAKPPAGVRPTRRMLQALLADRFKLRVHADTRQGTIWNLTLTSGQGKPGPQLRPSTCGTTPDARGITNAETALQVLMAGPTVCTPVRIAGGPSLVGEASIGDLASILSNATVVDAPVADRTGLTGTFNILLRWRAENNPNPDAGPPLFTALEEQLGLKLEKSSGMIDVVVIDSVEALVVD